jgi:hypothetical protein
MLFGNRVVRWSLSYTVFLGVVDPLVNTFYWDVIRTRRGASRIGQAFKDDLGWAWYIMHDSLP